MFTIETNYMDLDSTITIVGDTLKLKINKADLKIAAIVDSTIGEISTTVMNGLISIFSTILVGVINVVTNDVGISLDNTLARLGITFVKFGKTTLTPLDGYFLFYTTFIFNMEDFKPSWMADIELFFEEYFDQFGKTFVINEDTIINLLRPASEAAPEAKILENVQQAFGEIRGMKDASNSEL